MNWPETIYSFTKPGKSIVTWKFVEVHKDGRGNYFSNYNQHNYISQVELEKYYYTSLESCYEAWIDSIEKFKQKVIKQFEKKCGIDYDLYSKRKLVEENPEIKARLKDVLEKINNGTYWSENIDL